MTGIHAKAGRNRTIDLTPLQEQEYLQRCICVRPEESLDSLDLVNHTIYGDTFTVMPRLHKGLADLVIVDPPYNMDKTFGTSHFRHGSHAKYREYTLRWLEMVRPLMKPTASIYVCCDWQSSPEIGLALEEFFHVRNRITWQREKGRGALHNWKNGMEDIWYATVSDAYTFHVEDVMMRRKVNAPYREGGRPKDWEETPTGNFRNTYPSNFWDDISIPYWSMPENTNHPTQKPEKLLAKLILASSNEGDLVFDPFLGSGSTSVTAYKLHRRYLGIEQEAQYCALAERRLELAVQDPSIQGYTDGVFWERNTGSEQKKAQKQKANQNMNKM